MHTCAVHIVACLVTVCMYGVLFQEEFTAHDESVNCVAFGHKSGQILVTGGEDKKVNFWALGQKKCLLVNWFLCLQHIVQELINGFFNYYLYQGGTAFSGVCWFVNLQGYMKSKQAVFIKFSRIMDYCCTKRSLHSAVDRTENGQLEAIFDFCCNIFI